MATERTPGRFDPNANAVTPENTGVPSNLVQFSRSGVEAQVAEPQGVTEVGGALTHVNFSTIAPPRPRTEQDHGVPPTQEEIEYSRTGPHEDNLPTKAAKSKLGMAAAAVLGIAGGTTAYQVYNPGLIPGIVENASGAIQTANAPKPDVFYPRANSGEITSLNSTPVSLEDALKRVKEQTEIQNKYFFLLPEIKPDSKITYERKTVVPAPGQPMEVTSINGVSEDDIFVSPYDAVLTWQRYELGGGMGVRIRKMKPLQGTDPNIPAQVEYRMKHGELLIPEDRFTTGRLGSPGAQTIYSSEVTIKAGTPIFRVLGPETIGGPTFGNNQVGVIGATVLEDNSTAKAITTQTLAR